jgi:hypothetical protein
VFNVFVMQSMILTVVTLVVFVIEAWAFVDALTRKPAMFQAGNKMTKQAWLIILGLALVAHLIFWSPISLLNIAGTIAALVYLLDVRPALRALRR